MNLYKNNNIKVKFLKSTKANATNYTSQIKYNSYTIQRIHSNCHYDKLGFARVGQQHGGAAQGAVGRLGPYSHLRGPLRCR